MRFCTMPAYIIVRGWTEMYLGSIFSCIYCILIKKTILGKAWKKICCRIFERNMR